MKDMSIRGGLIILLISLVAFSVACSQRSLSVDDSAPPVFKLSGNYAVNNFRVSRKDTHSFVWYFQVLGGETTMSDIGSVKYGEIPPCCAKYPQLDPASKAIALGEGVNYVAAVDIYDGPGVWIEFTIKKGKAVVTSTSTERGY